MDLPMLPSILSMPPHCHRALRLKFIKVPGTDWYLSVGEVNDYFAFPTQYNFCSQN